MYFRANANKIMSSLDDFLAGYPPAVAALAHHIAQRVREALPDAIEQVDLPARMIAYSYGPKYADLVCVILPSQKGVKLGFNRGPGLPDPQGWLKGNAKTTRYVEMRPEWITHPALGELLAAADQACRLRRVQ